MEGARRGRFFTTVLAGALALGGAASASDSRETRAERKQDKPAVQDLAAGEKDGLLAVSFRVANAFTDELREEIDSGIPVSFTHQIQAVRERRWWWNRKVAAREIVTAVRYDTLTHQYRLTREADGAPREEWASDKAEDAARWMTHLDGVPLALGAKEKGTVTHVRARTEIGSRRILFVFPWAHKTPWAQITFED